MCVCVRVGKGRGFCVEERSDTATSWLSFLFADEEGNVSNGTSTREDRNWKYPFITFHGLEECPKLSWNHWTHFVLKRMFREKGERAQDLKKWKISIVSFNEFNKSLDEYIQKSMFTVRKFFKKIFSVYPWRKLEKFLLSLWKFEDIFGWFMFRNYYSIFKENLLPPRI